VTRTRAVGLLLVIALGAVTGCDYLERRQVEKILDRRAAALAAGDANAYFSCYSNAARDEWPGLATAREKLAARLKQRPLPSVTFVKREIFIRDGKAVVAERFTLADSALGPGRRYDETGHLLLRREGDGWRITGGDEVLKLLSGRIAEEVAIEQTLLRREAALVNKDLDSYMSLVSPRYRHQGEGPAELQAKVRRNFQIYDDLQFRSYDRKIWFFGDSATVEQRFTMQAGQVGTPESFNGRERFELERTGSGWQFVRGL
jgi:hypothetical protein